MGSRNAAGATAFRRRRVRPRLGQAAEQRQNDRAVDGAGQRSADRSCCQEAPGEIGRRVGLPERSRLQLRCRPAARLSPPSPSRTFLPRLRGARGRCMSDVFVSYKAEDRPRVRPLVEALEAEGLAVWWDERVGGGEAWRESIEQQLDGAACVIVVWSKRSTAPEGRFVRDEATRAERRRTYLPVRIDKVEPPLGFGEMQALNLSGWKGDRSDARYHALSGCIHSMLGRKAPTIGRAAPKGLVSRRAVLAGGGV